MAEENPTAIAASSPPSSPPAEIVANPDFVAWTYPPYCELCNVYFPGEACSKTHFLGNGHQNRLKIWEKYNNPEEIKKEVKASKSKNVVCRICWKEMNTQIILDQHCQSPAHAKEDKGRLIVQKLKEQYRQLRGNQC